MRRAWIGETVCFESALWKRGRVGHYVETESENITGIVSLGVAINTPRSFADISFSLANIIEDIFSRFAEFYFVA